MKQRMLSEVLKERFGTKVYKLSLTSGCTCPNRDGRIGTGGCTFCSEGGSGEFAAPLLPLEDQIRLARQPVDAKIPARIPVSDRKYIAYFQSFTNTYAGSPEELERLRKLYLEAVRRPEIAVLSLGTRPDCLPPEVLDMLQDLQAVKPVWVELGLQTIHERTARTIRRGYPLSVFEQAVRDLKEIGAEVIVHVILGLPGETREEMLDTVRYLAAMDPPVDGIKLQQLQVLRGTRIGEEYMAAREAGGRPAGGPAEASGERDAGSPGTGKGTEPARESADVFPYHIMSLEEYCALICDCLEILPEEIVIHRLTGDGPKSLLIAPAWSADKKRVLNTMRKWIR